MANWTYGVPNTSNGVNITFGEALVFSPIDIINATILPAGALDFLGSEVRRWERLVNNFGNLRLDTLAGFSGANLLINGALTNSITGAITMTASGATLFSQDLLSAGSLDNSGTITLNDHLGAIAALQIASSSREHRDDHGRQQFFGAHFRPAHRLGRLRAAFGRYADARRGCDGRPASGQIQRGHQRRRQARHQHRRRGRVRRGNSVSSGVNVAAGALSIAWAGPSARVC